MNKANLQKLSLLRNRMTRFAKEVEAEFSPEKVALAKYRCGADGTSPHYAKDVAKKFKVSESRVAKVTKQVDDFLTVVNREDAKKPKQPVAKQQKSTLTNDVHVEANMETGKVEIKAASPEDVLTVREGILAMIRMAKMNRVGQVDYECKVQQDKTYFWLAVFIALSGGVTFFGTQSRFAVENEATVYSVGIICALIAVFIALRALKLNGKRQGIKAVRRTL